MSKYLCYFLQILLITYPNISTKASWLIAPVNSTCLATLVTRPSYLIGWSGSGWIWSESSQSQSSTILDVDGWKRCKNFPSQSYSPAPSEATQSHYRELWKACFFPYISPWAAVKVGVERPLNLMEKFGYPASPQHDPPAPCFIWGRMSYSKSAVGNILAAPRLKGQNLKSDSTSGDCIDSFMSFLWHHYNLLLPSFDMFLLSPSDYFSIQRFLGGVGEECPI